MAKIDVTNRFLNENKRYEEGVVVTIPSVLQHGGGRSNADPVYLQGGDEIVAQVIEEDTIIKKAYIIIDEAFPSGASIAVNVGTDVALTAIDGTTVAMTASSTFEDEYYADKAEVKVVVSGITGDVLTGKARVVLYYSTPIT